MENKLGIIAADALADAEERLGKLGARKLFDSGRLVSIPVGTYGSLVEIHKALVGDVYDSAGTLRTVELYKGDQRFAPAGGLESAVRFTAIMSHDTYGAIIEKFAHMNFAHPFRTGNGRTLRLWLDVMIAAKLEALVDWSKIDMQSYMRATKNCATDARELSALIKSALTKQVGRSTFLRGIDGSFALDGYRKYKAELL